MTADEWVRDQLAKVTAERDRAQETLSATVEAVAVVVAALKTLTRGGDEASDRGPTPAEEPSVATPPESAGYQTPSDVAQAIEKSLLRKLDEMTAERDRYELRLRSVAGKAADTDAELAERTTERDRYRRALEDIHSLWYDWEATGFAAHVVDQMNTTAQTALEQASDRS